MNPLISANRLFNPLFWDEATAACFSTARIADHFLAFSCALVTAQAQNAGSAADKHDTCGKLMRTFKPDLEQIENALLRDGVPVPEYIRQLKVHVGPPFAENIHVGATSQDLIDTAFSMAIAEMNGVFLKQLSGLADGLHTLAEKHGHMPLMGRTRMQAALPIKVGDRLHSWLRPLEAAHGDLRQLRPRVEKLQLGGPVGNYKQHPDADQHATHIAKTLGLTVTDQSWHTDRGHLAEYASWLSRVTSSLGKMGKDVTLMAQQGIDEITLSGLGQSSAMPHKANPVSAEILITLSQYNAGQLSTMHHALAHEQERSGTAWALEWMTLPCMIMTTATAINHADRLVGSIDRIGTPDL